MSRCFPFPPPGYDKKIHLEDINLLSKEKKDKRDKEKKKTEGKDKKDRESSKEKHEKRKHRKEKHKDKKDDEKEKKRKISNDDKTSEMRPVCVNGEKIDSNTVRNNGFENSKYVQELARRIVDEERASERQIIEKHKVSDGGKINYTEPTNHLNGLAERKKDAGKASTSQNFHKINRDVDEGQIEIRGLITKSEETNREDDHRMVGGIRNSAVARSMEGSAKPLEKRDTGNGIVRKQNGESSGDGGNKFKEHKNRDQYKQRKSKDRYIDEETDNKDEKAKEMTELHEKSPQFVEGGPKLKDDIKIKPSNVYVAGNIIPAGEGNLCKRKDHERNGFSHANGNKSSKLQRSMAAPHTTTENGRKFKPFQTNNYKADSKELRVKNGFLEGRQQKVFSLPKATKTHENGRESAKPPQPDSKDQIQIHSAAKKDELLTESDEQEPPFGMKEIRLINGYVEGRQPKVFLLPKDRKTDENGEEEAIFGMKELRLKNGFVKGRHQKVFSLRKDTKTIENGEESAKPPQPDSQYQNQNQNHFAAKKDELLPESDEQEQAFGLMELRLKNGLTEGREQKVFSSPKAMKKDKNGEESVKPSCPDSKFQIQILSALKNDELRPDRDKQERLFCSKELKPKNGFSLPNDTKTDENGEESAKPPHPDSKQLIQILSITKKDELLPESDEQEWLGSSSSNNRSSKKPKLDSFNNNETLQLVWDQALRIESAEISALPYVLPY